MKDTLVISAFAYGAQVCGSLVMIDDGLMKFEAAIMFSPAFIVLGVHAGKEFLRRRGSA